MFHVSNYFIFSLSQQLFKFFVCWYLPFLNQAWVVFFTPILNELIDIWASWLNFILSFLIAWIKISFYLNSFFDKFYEFCVHVSFSLNLEQDFIFRV